MISTSTARPSRVGDPLLALSHLTDRDRRLLGLLENHQVLTTDQIHRLFFTGLRTCQARLRLLHRVQLLDRFRQASLSGGPQEWRWTLGPTGARFQAAVAGRRPDSDRAHRDKVIRLMANPALGHLLVTNEFFVRLLTTARATPTASLDRWWSERAATAAFLGIRPDGHALWTAHGRTVGLFLEVDLGTEDLPRVTAKLAAYARLARSGGPRYPVLFWLPGRQREINLRRHLESTHVEVPVATATHDRDPADAVWLPADAWRRVRLTDLDSHHGSDSAHNPNWRAGRLDLRSQPLTTGQW
ncbi:MAG: replication-relaxation family protein [Actinomycetota bacterium]|nr:replication-relaxation family protein [Actinomycetota bacterium]